MFSSRYFGARYWEADYFIEGGADVVVNDARVTKVTAIPLVGGDTVRATKVTAIPIVGGDEVRVSKVTAIAIVGDVVISEARVTQITAIAILDGKEVRLGKLSAIIIWTPGTAPPIVIEECPIGVPREYVTEICPTDTYVEEAKPSTTHTVEVEPTTTYVTETKPSPFSGSSETKC